ncbi:MAG: restriction endonuclease subunit S [Paludibacteraceae bacterium]|nr:restriction endonuclease subunit S [Paludibacteraceae bacterium]
MPYTVPQHIDPNKIFLVNFSELEGRMEPEYYQPSLASLEKRISSKSSKRLRDYALSIAGGATPSKSESNKYYTDSDHGIPFLRVQNLSTIGDLLLDDCIYINDDTHNNILKRSQVSEGDLLVKITGVGRMAIASVAPNGFVGNTNQHMVVIKTGNANVSKYIARYLNLDIIERIASRHSTGGTRPALDYSSLKKIPIIENLDFSVIDKAISLRKEKLAQAKAKLASIDQYLLGELGITLPEDSHEKTFIVNYKDVDGGRLDPKSYCNNVKNLKNAITDSSFEKQPLSTFIVNESSGDWGEDIERKDLDFANYTKCLVLRATEFDNRYNLKLDNSRVKYRYISNAKLRRMNIQTNDLIIEKSGGSEDQPVGRIGILTREILGNKTIAFSNFLHKITVTGIDPQYLFFYLKTMHNIGLTDSMQSQTNGIRNLIMSEYKRQNIIVPDKQAQTQIADHISAIRAEAKALEQEADAILEQAKKKVEEMILG